MLVATTVNVKFVCHPDLIRCYCMAVGGSLYGEAPRLCKAAIALISVVGERICSSLKADLASDYVGGRRCARN